MSCCKRIRPAADQQAVVNKVQEASKSPSVSVFTPNTGTKSNRSPAGTIARQCQNCGTKTISKICPICQAVLS